MTIKELFDSAEGGTLTYEQFEALTKEKGLKFADLSDGKYVSKSKYDSDLRAKDTEIESKVSELETANAQIETLNGTIATRDNDLSDLKSKLEAAGEDATKLAELSASFTGLQEKYEADVQAYENKMKQQAYEFAVKDFANTKQFTSQAAKRDFIQSMISRGLQMENGKILGREDFVDNYSAENADAFVVEKEPEPAPEPEPEPAPAEPKVTVPEFVAPTPGPEPSSSNDGGFHFNFQGVRAHN